MDFIDNLVYISSYNMINFLIRFRVTITLLLDLFVGAISLILMLLIRYGGSDFNLQLDNHLFPFTLIILVFILGLYIFNLYSARFNRSITEFNDSFIKSIVISFSLSIIVFYVFGDFFNLTPKTNLLMFTVLFGLLDFYVRVIVRRQYSRRKINRKVVLIGGAGSVLIDEIKRNQDIGYEIVSEMSDFNFEEIVKINPDIVIVETLEDKTFDKLYALLKNDISVYSIELFYEEVFQKIPTDTLDKDKVIEYVSRDKAVFTSTKRLMDVVMSLFLIVILSPIFVIIAIIIKLTSRGPVFFRQTRVAKNDEEFKIYKFRSMHVDSERDGAVWTKDDRTDTRITHFGRLLRKSHMDELPQLINIFLGDISLVGPRPERPEFTKMLNEQIKYYDLRHSVKPGLTGWAQINYRYGSSIEDTKEKLKYDFYYIKNRNIFLDILIIAKTVAMILKKH